MSKEEIIEEVAEKTRLPEDKVKLVIDSLWSGVRYYLHNPEECKGGIILPGFITIALKKYKLENTLSKKRDRTNSDEFYEKLLNLNNQYERQKRKKNVSQ